MIRSLTGPVVHRSWTHRWWAGSEDLAGLFGLPPSLTALEQVASCLPHQEGWQEHVHRAPERPVPADALVVLAGQQPVLAGGPALVAHKAATAIALARDLQAAWGRPVVPLFLLATQDHDSAEIDHLDIFDSSKASLLRIRCPISPRWEAFFRASWEAPGLARCLGAIKDLTAFFDGYLRSIKLSDTAALRVPVHVAELIDQAFGPLGLRIIEAHRLEARGRAVLERALRSPAPHRTVLEEGAQALRSCGLPISFDPRDPRPLVLASTDGRRRRIADGGQRAALALLSRRPEDLSPHAALRPVAQAAALPVVAQVCGPSELLYLAQARALHGLHGQVPPILVPRLEATRVPAGAPDALERAERLERSETPWMARAEELLREAERFGAEVLQRDPGLEHRVDRFQRRLERDVRRLAAAPAWRGKVSPSLLQFVRPRGRPQDTVLAWAPDAWSTADPTRWGGHIVDLCQPLEPPRHCVHTLPWDDPDG